MGDSRRPRPKDLEDLALGDDYALNPEYVEMVADALDRGDTERLRELVWAPWSPPTSPT
jgi:magnesium transporter